jgi:eukaryotic-like serine/threonine-protein kinase
MDIAPGSIIGKKYLLDRELVRLGERPLRDRGSVWVARPGQLGLPVALKLFHAEQAGSLAFLARMEREVRAAAALRTRHVARSLDHGTADGVPFLAMDLLFGEDLATRLLRCNRLSLQEAHRIGAQAGEALRCAHADGILHQNLRPESLFLALEGGEEVVKVLDFGLARGAAPLLLAEVATDVSPSALHYLSPEQIRAERDLDARTDLWSFAVLLFRAITGELPFPGDLPSVVASKILLAPVPSALRLVPRLPAALDGFFEKAFARDRARRFRSVDELIEALAPIADAAPPPSSGLGARSPVTADAAPMDRMRARLASLAQARAAASRATSVAPRPLDLDRSSPETLMNAASPDLPPLVATPARGRWLFPAGAIVVLGAAAFLTTLRLPNEAPPEPAATGPAPLSVTDELRSPLPAHPAVRSASAPRSMGSSVQGRRAAVRPTGSHAPGTSARPLSSRPAASVPPERSAVR